MKKSVEKNLLHQYDETGVSYTQQKAEIDSKGNQEDKLVKTDD